jgi:hypothetical protein
MLKIDNETDSEVYFYPHSCYAVQRKRQYRYPYPPKINTEIPPRVFEEGSLSFETIDYKRGNVLFHFRLSHNDIAIEVELD